MPIDPPLMALLVESVLALAELVNLPQHPCLVTPC